MLINTAPYDCLMYIFILILNIAFIVNVFMLSIEQNKRTLIKIYTKVQDKIHCKSRITKITRASEEGIMLIYRNRVYESFKSI